MMFGASTHNTMDKIKSFLKNKYIIVFYIWAAFLLILQVYNTFGFSKVKSLPSVFVILASFLLFFIIVFVFISELLTVKKKEGISLSLPVFSLAAAIWILLIVLINYDIITKLDVEKWKFIAETIFSTVKLFFITLFFFISAYAFGRKILGFFKFTNSNFNQAENIFISLGLGVGIISYLIFFVSLGHAAYSWVIWTLLLLGCFWGAKEIKSFFLFLLRKKIIITIKKKNIEGMAMLFLAVLFFITLIYSLANILNAGWDTFHQYLTFPDVYQKNHGLVYFPYHPHWGFPQAGEMVILTGLLLGGLPEPFVISYFFGILGILTLYLIFNEFGKKRAIWAISILAGVPFFLIFQSGYLKLEMILFFYIALIFLVFRKITNSPDSIKLWVIFSIFCGLAISIKYTSFIFLAALAVPMIIFYKKFLLDWKKIILSAFIILAIFSPWIIKNIIYYQSPLYPLFSGRDFFYDNFNADCGKYFMNICNEDEFIFSDDYALKTDNQIESNFLLTANSFLWGNNFDILSVGPFFILFFPLIIILYFKTKDIYIKTLIIFSLAFFLLGIIFFTGQIWYFLPFLVSCLIIISFIVENNPFSISINFIKYLILLWLFLVTSFLILLYGQQKVNYFARGQYSLEKSFNAVRQGKANSKKYYWYQMEKYINKKILNGSSNHLIYGFMDPQGFFIRDSNKNFIPDFFGSMFNCLSQKGDIYAELKKMGVEYFIFDAKIYPACNLRENKQKFQICRTRDEFKKFIKENGNLVYKKGDFRIYSLR